MANCSRVNCRFNLGSSTEGGEREGKRERDRERERNREGDSGGGARGMELLP
jgi:hypothetical protein